MSRKKNIGKSYFKNVKKSLLKPVVKVLKLIVQKLKLKYSYNMNEENCFTNIFEKSNKFFQKCFWIWDCLGKH